MKRITFKYRDKYNYPNWSTTTGEFESVSKAIEWYGLGVDCEYEIIKVEDI